MEYLYAILILNEQNREINQANVTEVLEAVGVDVVESRVRALVAALEGVDIDDVEPAPAAAAAEPTGQSEAGADHRDEVESDASAGPDSTARAGDADPVSGESGDDSPGSVEAESGGRPDDAGDDGSELRDLLSESDDFATGATTDGDSDATSTGTEADDVQFDDRPLDLGESTDAEESVEESGASREDR